MLARLSLVGLCMAVGLFERVQLISVAFRLDQKVAEFSVPDDAEVADCALQECLNYYVVILWDAYKNKRCT